MNDGGKKFGGMEFGGMGWIGCGIMVPLFDNHFLIELFDNHFFCVVKSRIYRES